MLAGIASLTLLAEAPYILLVGLSAVDAVSVNPCQHNGPPSEPIIMHHDVTPRRAVRSCPAEV